MMPENTNLPVQFGHFPHNDLSMLMPDSLENMESIYGKETSSKMIVNVIQRDKLPVGDSRWEDWGDPIHTMTMARFDEKDIENHTNSKIDLIPVEEYQITR